MVISVSSRVVSFFLRRYWEFPREEFAKSSRNVRNIFVNLGTDVSYN